MSAVEKRDNEIKGRRQKEGFLANIQRILKTEESLTGHLDWEDIDISKSWEIHRLPQKKFCQGSGFTDETIEAGDLAGRLHLPWMTFSLQWTKGREILCLRHSDRKSVV
jgi:hypothetical protein